MDFKFFSEKKQTIYRYILRLMNFTNWCRLYLFALLIPLSQVIGLHKNGYGRVLAECMFTAKIMYCMWITLADNDDNFVIETTKPLPKFKNWTEMQQKKFIKERILGKSNEELAQVTQISDCFTGGR